MMTQTAQTRPNFSEGDLAQRRDYDRSRPLERDESAFLIGSDKVEDTDVYATDGDKIGQIKRLMIGKRSGRVEYAVMSFGGFLGLGESYHALPWDTLDYDPERGGYVVMVDKEKLRDAPRFEADKQPAFDRQFGEGIYGYYGVVY